MMLAIPDLEQAVRHMRTQVKVIQLRMPAHHRAKIRDRLTNHHVAEGFMGWRSLTEDGLSVELYFPQENVLRRLSDESSGIEVEHVITRSSFAAKHEDQSWDTTINYLASQYIRGRPKVDGDNWYLGGERLSIYLTRSTNTFFLEVSVSEQMLVKQNTRLLSEFIEEDIRARLSTWVWLVKPNMSRIGATIRQVKNLPPASAATNRRTFHETIGTKRFLGQYLVRRKLFRPDAENRSAVLFGMGG